MIEHLSPGLILVVGAFLVPLLRGPLRAAYMLALPLLCGGQMLTLTPGEYGSFNAFDYTLVMLRVDKLSLIFGYIFTIASFLSVIYALHIKDTVQQVSGMAYAGAAICAAFAGDLISLFVFWELTAITSVFLIWASARLGGAENPPRLTGRGSRRPAPSSAARYARRYPISERRALVLKMHQATL